MNNTTRNAPFGTDHTPHFQIKIVGGRKVEVLRENEEHIFKHIGQLRDVKSVPLPQKGPNGTPPILNQPIWTAYDRKSVEDEIKPSSNFVERKASSFTEPIGDRSFSYMHGKKVLPPISNGVGANDYDSLEAEVSKQLTGLDSSCLKSMYRDLANTDQHLTGLASETQISLSALRHNLPINRSLLQLIMAKFLNGHGHNLIKYEALLKYLSKCKERSKQDIQTNGQTHGNYDVYTVNKNNKHGRSKTSPAVLMMNSPIITSAHIPHDHEILIEDDEQVPVYNGESKIVQLVTECLSPPADTVDLVQLHNALQQLDNRNTGELPAHVLRSNMIKYRIPLTASVIEKLLSDAETQRGMVDWKAFMDPLVDAQNIINRKSGKKAVKLASLKLQNKKQNLPSHELNTPLHVPQKSNTAPWEKSPIKNIPHKIDYFQDSHSFYSLDSQASGSFHLPEDGLSLPNSASSTASSARQQLPDGWDEHESFDLSPRRTEPWLVKFNKLAHALRSYHPHQPDILSKEAAERVTKNYNLIYGLGFSEKRIEAAVNQVAKTTNKVDSQLVPVQELLDVLSGKKRMII